MKFYVISDVHYISRTIIEDEGSSLISSGQELPLVLSPNMAEEVFRRVSEDDEIDTILLPGDLTNWGDRESHEALIKMLRGLQEKGKRVFVTTATHDFAHCRGYVKGMRNVSPEYKEAPWSMPEFDPNEYNGDYYESITKDRGKYSKSEIKPTFFEACSPAELWDMYYDFGRKDAFTENPESYSYCCELDDKTWVIMLNDNFRNEEAMGNVSVTYPPSCFRWIRGITKRAEKEGKFVFACTHHPLVPPVPAYKLGATYRNMRHPCVGHALADCGLDLVITGHTHFCNISFMRSQKGNLLCDISVPSVRSFPPAYRRIELDGQNHNIKVELLETPDIGYDFGNGKTVRDFLRDEFIEEYRRKVTRLGNIGKLILSLRVKHIYPICALTSKLSSAEYQKIKDIKIFDIIMELALNMQSGDGKYTPDTPVYKFMMGFAAVADSIIDTQPFYDVRKKVLLGYSCREIVEPMLFNNFIPDADAEFDFTKEPKPGQKVPLYKSQAGTYLLAALWLMCTAISPFLTACGLMAVPLLSVRKRLGLKNNPTHPLDIY